MLQEEGKKMTSTLQRPEDLPSCPRCGNHREIVLMAKSAEGARIYACDNCHHGFRVTNEGTTMVPPGLSFSH